MTEHFAKPTKNEKTICFGIIMKIMAVCLNIM